MESFIEFVSDIRIIQCVCRKRASEAAKRHTLHHKRAISCDYKVKNPDLDIYDITPPRRQWIRLGENRRYRRHKGLKQNRSSLDIARESLLLTIRHDLEHNPNKLYLIKLKEFIGSVKNNIQDPTFKLSSPVTIPFLKKKNLIGPDEYRPISLYENLTDAIIIILANQYLSRVFDEFFYEDSLAFRPKRIFHGKKTITTHHHAISLILGYLHRVGARNVYVAECDMQKFYDTVDHKVVEREYERLITKAKLKYPDLSFDQINRVFKSYLDSYTFTSNVFGKNTNKEFWDSFKVENGYFGWVSDLSKIASQDTPDNLQVGVPQGGAISGLIANIVLNQVDDTITPNLHYSNDLYIRYCDDMILLSTNKQRANKLFRLYNKTVRNANLYIHTPSPLKFGTKDFWKAKTRCTYQWILDNKQVGSRWIGFVGYEMNRRGDVRIRKSSVRKEILKQRKVIKELFKLVYKKQRVSDSSMIASYQNTLISMSVGRVTLWNYASLKNDLCWINGFKMLNDNPYVKTQIRYLDRCRNRTIQIANNRLCRLNSKIQGTISKEGNWENSNESLSYYGKPFSYYCHYEKNLNEEL